MGVLYLLLRHAVPQQRDDHLVAHLSWVLEDEGGPARGENGRGVEREVPPHDRDFLGPEGWYRSEHQHRHQHRYHCHHAVSSVRRPRRRGAAIERAAHSLACRRQHFVCGIVCVPNQHAKVTGGAQGVARPSLTLLGGFEARLDDGSSLGLPTHKYKALLAYLAVPAGQAHPRDELVALLWGSLPREQGRAALRQALWALRKALDRGGLRTLSLEDDAVALHASAVHVDVTDFEQAIQGGPESLGRAAVLYRGSFLAGMAAREAPFEEWLMQERDRLAELAVQGLGRLLAAQRTAGDHEAAVGTALRLLALDPVQEPVHRVLMQLYVSLGRHGAALRQYQSCVTVLERDLGIEPEPETRALYQDILRRRSAGGMPIVRSEPRPRPAAEMPAAANSVFVGRQLERALLREALDQAVSGRGQVVAVEGEAGIGKTRLVTELAADAAGQGARIIFGRAYESDQVLPFGPWADALRRAQLASAPEIAELRPAWRAELGRLVPDLADPTALLTGSVDSMQLFEGIVQLVAALARSGPVVIVLDDLHWADDMSLRLLSFVARRISDALAVLLIVTAAAA